MNEGRQLGQLILLLVFSLGAALALCALFLRLTRFLDRDRRAEGRSVSKKIAAFLLAVSLLLMAAGGLGFLTTL